MIILVRGLQGHCPSKPCNACTDLKYLVPHVQGTEVLKLFCTQIILEGVIIEAVC